MFRGMFLRAKISQKLMRKQRGSGSGTGGLIGKYAYVHTRQSQRHFPANVAEEQAGDL